MKKQSKIIFWPFLPIDYKAAQDFLTAMAQKGWMLKSIGRVFAKFEAIEASNLIFSIDVYKHGGPLTPDNSKQAKEYRDFCEQFGWKYITSRDYLQVFYAQKSDHPTKLQTDEHIEQSILEQSLLKSEYVNIVAYVVLAYISLRQLFPISYNNVLNYTSFMSTLVLPVLFTIMIGSNLVTIYRVFQAKRRVKLGLSMKHRSLSQAKRASLIINTPILFGVVLLMISYFYDSVVTSNIPMSFFYLPLSSVFIGVFIQYLVKKKSTDQRTSVMIVTIGIIATLVLTSFLVSVVSGQNLTVSDEHNQLLNQTLVISASEIYQIKPNEKAKPHYVVQGSSPIIKQYLIYSEIIESNNESLYLKVEYFNATSNKSAQWLFKEVFKSLEKGVTYQGELLYNTPLKYDDVLKEIWNVDQLAISSNDQSTIVLLKENRVVVIEATIDYKNPDIINLITKRLIN